MKRVQVARYIGIIFAASAMLCCGIRCKSERFRARHLLCMLPLRRLLMRRQRSTKNSRIRSPASGHSRFRKTLTSSILVSRTSRAATQSTSSFSRSSRWLATDDWNLITRPVFQVVNSVPVQPRRVGLSGDRLWRHHPGDASFAEPESGGTVAPWRGTYLHLSYCNHDKCRPEKVAVGTRWGFRYLGEHYIIGIFPQQWFSVGGNGSKQTSQMNLQYFASYFLPHGWSVCTSPNMLINWYASDGNKVTFPIGLNVAKVQKIGPLPVKFQVQGQYMPVNPSVFGQRWNIQVSVTPVIPKLVKGNILEGW